MLKEKTPPVKADGVFFHPDFLAGSSVKQCLSVLLLALLASSSLANCPAQRIDEVVRIAHVYDGDTLRLEDGRRVRMLGINAPEMAQKSVAAEPLGQSGQRAVATFFRTDKQAYLSYDRQRHDRYGRLLAHVYNQKGESLAASLLRDGLAFHIVVPPNLSAAECLHQQQQAARDSAKGVWREPYWRARPAAKLKLTDTGFLRVQGTVVKITEGRDIWLELNGPLVLKIAAQDKHLFSARQWQNWRGKRIEVTGWVIDRTSTQSQKRGFKPLQLQLRSPYAVTLAAE